MDELTGVVKGKADDKAMQVWIKAMEKTVDVLGDKEEATAEHVNTLDREVDQARDDASKDTADLRNDERPTRGTKLHSNCGACVLRRSIRVMTTTTTTTTAISIVSKRKEAKCSIF